MSDSQDANHVAMFYRQYCASCHGEDGRGHGPVAPYLTVKPSDLIRIAARRPDWDLVVLGEMGIGNTTPAACIAAALFGGGGRRFAGHGTGLDDAGLARKVAVIDRALACHAEVLSDPLRIAACLGGRELAASLGAGLAARRLRIPVLVDGFVSTAAVAPTSPRTAR